MHNRCQSTIQPCSTPYSFRRSLETTPFSHSFRRSLETTPFSHSFRRSKLAEPPLEEPYSWSEHLFPLHSFPFCHNGTVSRHSLPLRQHIPTVPRLRLSEQHCPLGDTPQRHRFPHFAAVAVWSSPPCPLLRLSERYSPSVPLPQRQNFPRFPAIAAPRFALHSVIT